MDKSVHHLSKILADTFLLYTKTLNFHWCVEGPLFPQLHELFGDQYDALAEDIDTIAERIRALKAMPPATMKEFLELTHLKEPKKGLKDMDMVKELLHDREFVIEHFKKDLEIIGDSDPATTNMLEDMLEKHEKHAWMLRAIVS